MALQSDITGETGSEEQNKGMIKGYSNWKRKNKKDQLGKQVSQASYFSLRIGWMLVAIHELV